MSDSIAGAWSQIEIEGKPADVYEPLQPGDQNRVVLHLHGHGLSTLLDNPVYSAELEKHGLRAICPHGQRSWWTDVVCAEFDAEISPLRFLKEYVVPYIGERWDCRPPSIGLTGISMGGQGVLQLAFRHAREFPVVAAIAPAVDFHNWWGQGLPLDEMFPDRESARQQTALLQIHPLDWPRHQLIVCDPADTEWFESADKLAMKLSSSGVPFESDLETTAGGHDWSYFDRMAEPVIRFVAERLETESRRV